MTSQNRPRQYINPRAKDIIPIDTLERPGLSTGAAAATAMDFMVLSLPIKYGFTIKAETQGSKAKIHFLNEDNRAKCNPYLDIDINHIYNGQMGDIIPEDVCKTCLKRERGG